MLGPNPKLPKDTRLIVFNPRWCFDVEFADHLHTNLKQFVDHEWCHLDWFVYCDKSYEDVAAVASARFLAMPEIEVVDPHEHMKGRSPEFDDDKIKPISLVVKIMQVLKKLTSRAGARLLSCRETTHRFRDHLTN